jgi:adenylate kinase
MKIIIFGPQASGKGTQAQVISEKYIVPQITMGDLFRNEISQKSAIGQKIEGLINQGKLVEDELTFNVLKNRLRQADCQNGFILDGFPRNINQAKALDQIIKIDVALEIWISDQESIKRIGGRRSCPKCGTVYHLITNPAKVAEVCDKCQSQLIIREDDKIEVIKKRLEQYHQQTEMLIDYYQQQKKLIKINGTPSIPVVTKDVLARLSSKPKHKFKIFLFNLFN